MARCPQNRGAAGFYSPARSAVTSLLFQPCPSRAGERLSQPWSHTEEGAEVCRGEEREWRSAWSSSPRVRVQKGLRRPASQHQEEEQHDQQDCEEDGDGTPLAPIWKAGHRDDLPGLGTPSLPGTQVLKHQQQRRSRAPRPRPAAVSLRAALHLHLCHKCGPSPGLS